MAEGSVFAGLPPLESALAQFAVQAVVVLSATRCFVYALRPLKQPAVIAEIVAGIVLGPSILGQIPGFSATIFPEESLPTFQLVANIG